MSQNNWREQDLTERQSKQLNEFSPQQNNNLISENTLKKQTNKHHKFPRNLPEQANYRDRKYLSGCLGLWSEMKIDC